MIRRGLPRIAAVANWGRWVLRCPACPNALAVEPGVELFTCPGCGTAAEIVWPPEEMVYGVERLLLMRPDESSRNWEPPETLVDLMMENGAHGIFDRVEGLLTVDTVGIRRDSLPSTRQPVLRAVAA